MRSRGDALSFPPLPENRMTYNLPRISANRPREIAGGNKGRGCAKRSGKMVYFITDFFRQLVGQSYTFRSFLQLFSYGEGGVVVNYLTKFPENVDKIRETRRWF